MASFVKFIMHFIFSAQQLFLAHGTHQLTAGRVSPRLLCFGSPHEVLGNPISRLSRPQHRCCAMLHHAAPLVVAKGGSVSESLRQSGNTTLATPEPASVPAANQQYIINWLFHFSICFPYVFPFGSFLIHFFPFGSSFFIHVLSMFAICPIVSSVFTCFLVISGALFRIAAASAWVTLATGGEPQQPTPSKWSQGNRKAVTGGYSIR